MSEGIETEASVAFSKGHPSVGFTCQGLSVLSASEKTLKGRIWFSWVAEHVPLCKDQ